MAFVPSDDEAESSDGDLLLVGVAAAGPCGTGNRPQQCGGRMANSRKLVEEIRQFPRGEIPFPYVVILFEPGEWRLIASRNA